MNLPESYRQRHQQQNPPRQPEQSESTAYARAKQRQMPWRFTQDPGGLRQQDQSHTEEDDHEGTHERIGRLHIAKGGQAQDEADAVVTQLVLAAVEDAFGEVAGPEVPVP